MTEADVERLLRGTEPLEGPGLPRRLDRELPTERRRESAPALPREMRLPRRTAMAAAGLVLIVTAWALLPRRPHSVEQAEPASPTREQSVQDPYSPSDDPLKKDAELRARVAQVAQEEKNRLALFETRLGELDKGLLEAEKELQEKRFQEASDRSAALLRSFPVIELAVLDPSAIDYRAQVLRLRLELLQGSAQLELLKDVPLPEANRAEAQIPLGNRMRKLNRELQDVQARGPQPRRAVVQSIGGAVAGASEATREKLRSMRITIDMGEASFSDCMKYLAEVSGLNFVLRGTSDERGRKVTVRLTDAIFEGALQEMATLANYKWEINSFGMVVFYPAHP